MDDLEGSRVLLSVGDGSDTTQVTASSDHAQVACEREMGKVTFDKWIQGKLCITRSLGSGNFVCYIRHLVISVVSKHYKTKEII